MSRLRDIHKKHPFPWRWEQGISSCPNGSDLHGILDANGECVASTYHGGCHELWDFYCVLEEDDLIQQVIELASAEE